MSTEWSRARLQRRDLGPMIHDIGYEIYDNAESMMLEQGVGAPPTNTAELVAFADRQLVFVHAALKQVTNSRRAARIDTFIQRNHNRSRMSSGALQSLTHVGTFKGVMTEGLTTGIVAPLQLFRTVEIVERAQDGDRDMGLPIAIDAAKAAGRIASNEFQTMLHQLGRMTNGALGSTSTSTRSLGVEPDMTGMGTFGIFKKHGLMDSFTLQEGGVVAGLSPDLLNYARLRKSHLRQSGERLSETSGCPVRYAEFPVLGPSAEYYFENFGGPDAQPRFQGESLISRGSRFVCAALRVSIEGVPE